MAIPAWKLAPALAYGNVCVWKPSELAPASRGAAHSDGGPPAGGVLSSCMATAMPAPPWWPIPASRPCHSPARRATGDGVAGAMVARGPQVQCEMGGQNAALVLADADVEAPRRDRRSCHGLRRPEVHGHQPDRVRGGGGVDARGDCRRGRADAGTRPSHACQVGPCPGRSAEGARCGGAGRRGRRPHAYRRGGVAAPATTCARRSSSWTTRLRSSPRRRYSRRCAHCWCPTPTPLAISTASGTGWPRRSSPVIWIARSTLPTHRHRSGTRQHADVGGRSARAVRGEKASGFGPREQGKAAREFYTSWRTTRSHLALRRTLLRDSRHEVYKWPPAEHPRLAADVAVFTFVDNEMQVLLVRRRYEPYQSYWALPGGLLRPGETLEQAAVRRACATRPESPTCTSSSLRPSRTSTGIRAAGWCPAVTSHWSMQPG